MKQEYMNTKGDDKIDLMELGLKVWSRRKFIFKACGIAIILGLLVAYSIPKEYTASMTMTPESGNKSSNNNMGALASMVGISTIGASNEDGLSPGIYPDIVSSTPFLLDLFSAKIKTQDGTKDITLYDYMDKHQKMPWWNKVISAPSKAVRSVVSLFGEKENTTNKDMKPDPFNLTYKQSQIANAIENRITVSSNSKNGILTLTVTMQDPLVSAILTDTLMNNLQSYITEYRTNKANRDLIYMEKLHKEAQETYYSAQQKYANFADSNLDIVLTGYRTRLDRLQNETTLAYALYNQISQQLQLAKAKVQEVTPAYTVIQPASVPLYPVKPNKPIILLGFLFFAFFGSVCWILMESYILRQLKNKPKTVDPKD